MSFWDKPINFFVGRIADAVASRVMTDSGQRVAKARAYRLGKQPKQLKVKANQYDDNIILNFIGLITDRAVSQLVGGGVGFKFEEPQGEQVLPAGAERQVPPQETFTNGFWDANKRDILLHRAALSASEAGTGYFFFNDPTLGMSHVVGDDEVRYPRLTVIDPAFVTMDTLPEDFEIVIRYTIEYKFIGVDGKEAARRRVVEQEAMLDENGASVMTEDDTQAMQWVIVDYEFSTATGNQWREVNRSNWPYPFAPILHWQNLPTIDSPYGEPDITDELIATQDSLNGDISNLNKSLRLGANPMRWARNYNPPKGDDGKPVAETGPDKMINVGPEGEVGQLSPEVDWPGSLAFAKFIKAEMFDISRTVDIDSLQDKLGSLTNFALKVIYQDNASKIETKRELFGEALEEVNSRIQQMGGFADPLDTDVLWPDFLPVNQQEAVTMVQTLLGLGVVSKETAYGMLVKIGLAEGEWSDEKERIEGDRQQTDNLGAFLLRGFNRGEGGINLPVMPTGEETQ